MSTPSLHDILAEAEGLAPEQQKKGVVTQAPVDVEPPAPVAAEAPAETRYVIEDGVPIPSVRVSNSRYPFGQLRTGQSFLVPYNDEEPAASTNSKVRGALQQFVRRRKTTNSAGKFVSSTGPTGIRVWRIE